MIWLVSGPANVLINLAVEKLIDPPLQWDVDGLIAAKGQTDLPFLQHLLSDPFFAEPPPKSTGRELFGQGYLEKIWERAQSRHLSAEDVIATLTSLTAHSIKAAYDNFLPGDQVMEVYFSGGGVHNHTLMQQLRSLLPHHHIHLFSELGMNPDAREAIGFAVLANELLAGHSVTLANITGGRHATALGKISLP